MAMSTSLLALLVPTAALLLAPVARAQVTATGTMVSTGQTPFQAEQMTPRDRCPGLDELRTPPMHAWADVAVSFSPDLARALASISRPSQGVTNPPAATLGVYNQTGDSRLLSLNSYDDL